MVDLSPEWSLGYPRYEYHHHGSIADSLLTLTEFHPAEGKK
jgi:hypothetical protein